mgnify:FL=1
MLHTNVHSWYAHDTSFGSARPSVEKIPNLALPFYPRSCGCFDYERGFRREESGRQKPMVHLFWGVKGRGRFETMYGTFDFREGDFFYLLPFDSWVSESCSSSWIYRWLTFDGESARTFMESYRIPHHPIAAGRCPERLFDEFEQGLHVRTVFEWRKMVALVCDILAHAVECREPEPQAEKIAEIAMERCRLYHSDPAFNVNALAEQLQLSRVTLFRIFRVALGVTPSEYIAELRCGHALELIRGTSLPMREVAARSGFADRTYFFRVIRKRFNASPRELRTRRAGGRTLLPE